jgi:tetratricopeptide (TPR) repeat protein
VRYESRGDVEVMMREVFHQLPEDNWGYFSQRLAELGELDGTVQGTKADDPLATGVPYSFTFQLDRADAVSWSNQRAELEVPLPRFDTPGSDTTASQDSVPVGLVEDITHRARIVLPANVTARLPAAVILNRDWVTYRSSAERRGDTLVVERVLQFTQRMLPPDRKSEFTSFKRIVGEDEDRTITLTRTGAAPAPGVTATAAGGDADELHRQGMAALDQNDARTAIRAFRRVTELVPRHQWAWNNLGRAYLQIGKTDSALLAFRKQVEINPYDQYAYNNMGLTLRRIGRRDEAVAAFRKQVEVNPLDQYAHANLGRLLVDMHRDTAAVDALEHAVSVTPDDTALQVLLGGAYARLGRGSDALAAFQRAIALSPTPEMWNTVAYMLAEQRLELDTAEGYARRAIDATEGILRDLALDDAGGRETFAVSRLGTYWDTMGWIYFGRGDLARAERWVRAAWLLSNESAIGEHLGQIQQRLGRSADAIHSYALAMNGTMPTKTIRPRLLRLLGGSERETDRRTDLASSELLAMRTIRLGKLLVADVSGEVEILLVPGPRVEAVRITSGPSQLEQLKPAIRRATFSVSFPEPDQSVKLLRRGVVSCSSPSGNCSLVLMPTWSVRMVPGDRRFIQRLPND